MCLQWPLEDIMGLQMLGGCNDSELLKKLLEVSPCVVEQLKQCAVTYESHKHTAGEIKGNPHRVSKVDSTHKRKKSLLTLHVSNVINKVMFRSSVQWIEAS